MKLEIDRSCDKLYIFSTETLHRPKNWGNSSNVVGTICPHPLVEIGLTALPGISNTPKSDIPVCMYIELYVCSRRATCHYINPVHFNIYLLFV